MSKFQVSLSQLPGFDFVGSSVFMDISVFIAWSATAGSGIGVVGVLGTCCNQRFFFLVLANRFGWKKNFCLYAFSAL
jgi:hypothetical protein